jgi:hypothetical protein
MRPHTQRLHGNPVTSVGRKVAIIGRQPQPEVFRTVLNAMPHDVVIVGPVAHAYSQIKQVTPDLVVLCMAADDTAACHLLSMLAIDPETAAIPVLTIVVDPSSDDAADTDYDEDIFDQGGARH